MSNVSENAVNDNDDDNQMLHPVNEKTDTQEAEANETEDPSLAPPPTQENNEAEEEVILEPFKDITRDIKLQSNFTDDVYIQMKTRFRRLLKSQITESKAESTEDDSEVAGLLQQYFGSVMAAVIIQMLLHNVTLVLQGLLAGLAVGHCVFAFVFAEPDVLVRGYQYMAVPVQAAFYFCFAISTVNAFDRFEVGGSWQDTIKKFLSLQRGGFNIIIWAAGTVSNALMATYDEYMSKPDIVVIEKADTLIIWRYLSLWRASCALLGWLFVALQPNTNYTRDRLLRLAGVNDLQKVQQQLLQSLNSTSKIPEDTKAK